MFIFSSTTKTWLLIFINFLVALILTFMPLPKKLVWLEVPWLVLVLCYFALFAPHYINVGSSFLVGFFLDIIYDVPLGMHALILVVMTYFIIKYRAKLFEFGFEKMAIIICGFIGLYQLWRFLEYLYLGYYFNPWLILSSSVISALVWTLLMHLLFNLQKKFRI